MKYSTLIFDLGNVVLTNDWHYECPEKFQEYSNYFGITYENMERGWKAFWPDFFRGKITEEEFQKGFLEIAGAKKIDVKEAKKLYRKYQRENEDMLSLLDKLKSKFKLAALTTISKEWLDWKRKKFNLDDYFSVYISSGYSGIEKTNPKIYDLVLEKLEVKAEECIFSDDQEKHLVPAKQKGIMTIKFISQQKLEARLRELGVL